MSTTTAPSGSASATPPSRTALRTTLPLGSIVTTIGTSANASGPLGGGAAVLARPGLGAGRVRVEADDVVAGARDVRRHRPAHGAEADEADGGGHAGSIAHRTRIVASRGCEEGDLHANGERRDAAGSLTERWVRACLSGDRPSWTRYRASWTGRATDVAAPWCSTVTLVSARRRCCAPHTSSWTACSSSTCRGSRPSRNCRTPGCPCCSRRCGGIWSRQRLSWMRSLPRSDAGRRGSGVASRSTPDC